MKYVAFRDNDTGRCMGWTTLSNIERNPTALADPWETVLPFDGPEYDNTDEVFKALGTMAEKVCKEYVTC